MKIKPNTEISTRSACNYDCIFTIKVISRTAKMATIIDYNGEKRRTKIHTDHSGVEYIMPERHSFAPVYKADKAVEFPPKEKIENAVKEMAQAGHDEIVGTSVSFGDNKSVITIKFA